MATQPGSTTWPPENLAEYYQSASFLNQLKTLQRRLKRSYPNADSENIVYDAAADLLVKEIGQHCIYDQFMCKYESEHQFFHYLYQTCCRKVIDNARSFQRKFRQLTDEDKVEDTGLGPEALAIESEETVKYTELANDLESVIAKLPKIDRLILKHRVAGKKFHEIAEFLDIAVSTVHRRHKASIERLATNWQDESKAKK